MMGMHVGRPPWSLDQLIGPGEKESAAGYGGRHTAYGTESQPEGRICLGASLRQTNQSPGIVMLDEKAARSPSVWTEHMRPRLTLPSSLVALVKKMVKEDATEGVVQGVSAAAPDQAQDAPACPMRQNAVASQLKDALAVLFAIRLINALCVRTFFQPDEYFQALEPAWQMVFGPDSGAWMTWEWQNQLRSSLHPGVFAVGYTIMGNYVSSIPMPAHYGAYAFLAVPKVMQAGFAALSDWFAWRLGERLFGQNTASAWSVASDVSHYPIEKNHPNRLLQLVMSIVNPWQWYCSTRTFSNSLEGTLTIAALFYFPWELLGTQGQSPGNAGSPEVFKKRGSVNSLRLSIIFATLAVLLRPTNVLIWLAVGTLAVTRLTLDGVSPLTGNTIFVLIREALLCGSLVLGLSLYADKQYFGEWTFPPLNTLYYNISQSLAIFYGQNDWHYYLSQGITLSCTTITPFAVLGLWSVPEAALHSVTTKNALKALSFAVLITISTLSFIVHKEVRFIYPLIPILHILAAPHITSFFTQPEEGGIPTANGPIGARRKPLLVLGLLVNLIIASYLSYFHAAAPISVMGYLRGEFERIHPENMTVATPFLFKNETAEPLELFALFLTPCHTTPWRSHLIYPALRARALTCEPPLHTAPGSPERAAYVDEGWRFDADKVGFLANELWPTGGKGEELPRYIIGFEGIEDALKTYFGPAGPGADKGVTLKQTWSEWNGLFTDDDRKAGEIRVWETGIY
ncbi:hypothetical protein JX266_000742 [Neoarthrinium moseri]|nr:hypothetical protein JX266_000742 [Neoarthrinium moseri]